MLDCGTGIRGLGAHLLTHTRGKIRGSLLPGHTHWDHIQGLPFFAPLFVPGNEWDIYAPHGMGAQLRDILAGQMEYAYFPVSLQQLGATLRFHELREEAFRIDDVTISTLNLNHPALTLGYRIEADRASLVYATDHEPHGHGAANPSAAVADTGGSLTVLGAADGLELEVEPARPGEVRVEEPELTPELSVADSPAPRGHDVSVKVDDPAVKKAVEAALLFCGLRAVEIGDGSAGAPDAEPLLAIVSPAAFPPPTPAPCVVILPQADEATWLEQVGNQNLLDVVTSPCSEQYLRARMEAWVMRRAPRWFAAPRSDDDATRHLHVEALGLLDTPVEERFERLVRLARRAFGVPIATVSLLDAHRQWLKTHAGSLEKEFPRDVSICAHCVSCRCSPASSPTKTSARSATWPASSRSSYRSPAEPTGVRGGSPGGGAAGAEPLQSQITTMNIRI